MKALHITSWYPSHQNPKEAIWIKRQIDALADHCENEVWHVCTKEKTPWFFRKKKKGHFLQWQIGLPTSKWILIEFVTFLQLLWLGIAFRKTINRADIINFHIAYPLLTFWKWLKPLYNKPVVITEHWSAYHFNFGVSKPLPRIQRIFHHNIPVIAVSRALGEDIKKFSGGVFSLFIVPNIVSDVFLVRTSKKRESFFFMVGQWKLPKSPFPLLNAFKRFNDQLGNLYQLHIGGYGPLYDDMLQWKKANDSSDSVIFLGVMDEKQIAEKMQTCYAFLHPTNYETFSVVCAEALSSGALVVAPNVGGIPEVVGDLGLLLDAWNEGDWFESLNHVIRIENRKIHLSKSFSAQIIGSIYMDVLRNLKT